MSTKKFAGVTPGEIYAGMASDYPRTVDTLAPPPDDIELVRAQLAECKRDLARMHETVIYSQNRVHHLEGKCAGLEVATRAALEYLREG